MHSQTLSEFNSLYHDVVKREINSQNNLQNYSDYIFPYAYQCNEATLAFAYALNRTIAGKVLKLKKEHVVKLLLLISQTLLRMRH